VMLWTTGAFSRIVLTADQTVFAVMLIECLSPPFQSILTWARHAVSFPCNDHKILSLIQESCKERFQIGAASAESGAKISQ
jgi:hypothetical protein